jgi:hypothetical protein
VMLYQLSHVRASCNQAARVRSETIAEAKAGVQTCPRRTEWERAK